MTSPNTSLVERMARAIGECLYCYVDPVDTPNTWGASEAAALAALKAMWIAAQTSEQHNWIHAALQEHEASK